MLGVATNRAAFHSYADPATSVHYYSLDTDVAIDLEHDPALVTFLQDVKEAVGDSVPPMSAAQAQKITMQVISQTPNVDEDYSYHERRSLTLGEALQRPVMCIDRCLAMDASLKMFGYQDARHLPSVITIRAEDKVEHHVDVLFTINGEYHVAITMGERAGTVMPIAEYMGPYLNWRDSQGLTVRIPHHAFQETETYFQATG